MKNKPRSEATKQKLSLALLDFYRKNPNKAGFKKGNKNVAWKGGTYSKSKLYVPKGYTERERLAGGRPRPEVCDVCKEKNHKKICFDHDHKTGKFRGWLCDRCNIVLGKAKDSPELLRKLANYLETCKKQMRWSI